MKKANRKSIHTALVAAKEYLCTADDIKRRKNLHKRTWICVAISSAYHHGDITADDCDKACQMIAKRLGSSYTILDDWVKAKIGVEEYSKCPCDKFQAYRWRWLESMIEEFSK